MTKLYELLVVEPQLKTQAEVTRKELGNTFEKKRHLFEEKRKTFTAADEGAQPVVEEQSDIQSTIVDELKWLFGIWGKAIDTSYKVASGNTMAKADVVLDDGTTLLTGAPATALLELEKRASELQELISRIPTLDPAKGFQPDPDRGRGYYKARDVNKVRTRKVQKALVLYPATDKHPAQTQLVSVDEPAGRLLEQEWSSFITTSQKASMIERVETLRRAIKAALYRANDVEMASTQEAATKIFSFVLAALD